MLRIRHSLRSFVRRRLVGVGYHSRPRFLIIGAQKAGTTALHYYLAKHPNIMPAIEKEIGFFTPERFGGLPGHAFHKILCPADGTIYSSSIAYARAAKWYHGLFPLPHVLGRYGLTFEATPEYLYYPSAAQRIWSYDPGMKLLVLLRDPVERAFSAWNMYHSFEDPIYSVQRETRSFEQAITDEVNEIESDTRLPGPHYVRRGLYHDQLRRYLDIFGREQVFVIDSRYLKSRTAAVVDAIADFLELPPFRDGVSSSPVHVGRYDTSPPLTVTRQLRAFYAPHNRRLYELLNRDFGWA